MLPVVARVLICEPVEETRVLIERLVQRMGHELVGLDALRSVDVLFYEPASRAGLALARRLQAERPAAALVACNASPPLGSALSPRPSASLLQPFSPADVRRVLEAALRGPAAATA
jgi:CheY-like chemotaxis protein